MTNKTIAVSGGFDPLHIGHLTMFKEAAKYGKLIVIVNSDEWLIRKKGFCFMPFEERALLIAAYSFVRQVIKANDIDDTVCKTLEQIKPTYFANGGDRTNNNTPELELCRKLGIEPLFNIGGGKVASSSSITSRNEVKRLWGTYKTLAEGDGYKVKELTLEPGKGISKQRHEHRAEIWNVVQGSARAWLNEDSVEIIMSKGLYAEVPKHAIHLLKNIGSKPAKIIEIQQGDYLGEDDIERFD